MTKKNVAINGFGRIGRLILRQLIESKNLQIVAINDLSTPRILAHLLKYDSAHGLFDGTIKHTENALIVNQQTIKVFNQKSPQDLPWKELAIDVVVESTGLFVTEEGAKLHLKAGAKKVVLSAPAKKGNIKTIVYSVNERQITKDDKIISAGSCTTNALAPIVNVLENRFGIEKGFMTTVHAYTADQGLQDKPHKDLRRARAAAVNIVPTTTGATIAVTKVLPSLIGKLDGIAIRVPVITGSLIDFVFELKQNNVTAKDINQVMREGSSESLAYLEEPIVSSDVIGTLHGSIFDSLMTKEISNNNKKLFKILAWYDNENSYVAQFVKTLQYFLSFED